MIDPNKIIIISTYPSTKYAEEILVSCINSVSNKGYDIMLLNGRKLKHLLIFLKTILLSGYYF